MLIFLKQFTPKQLSNEFHQPKTYLNPLLHNYSFWRLWNVMYLKILWIMEHLLHSISIIFSKVFKTELKYFLNFSMLSKNRKFHDQKIAYGVKGQCICVKREVIDQTAQMFISKEGHYFLSSGIVGVTIFCLFYWSESSRLGTHVILLVLSYYTCSSYLKIKYPAYNRPGSNSAEHKFFFCLGMFRSHPAIVAICYKKCWVATNASHWLRVQSRCFKNYVFVKPCILISFCIFKWLLLFLHTY